MTSIRNFALTGFALATLAGCSAKEASEPAATTDAATSEAATADAATGRVRGTVQAITDQALTVQTYDGRTIAVPVDAKTGYAWVVGSSLAALKDGDFVGTATTGPDTALRAVELVIFPEAMRGTGEGHYGWDVPGVVAASGGSDAGSNTMTNGTVDQQSAMTNGTVEPQSGMSNGTVTGGTVTGGASAAGARTLTISYKGGKARVAVPTGTPIVRFEPATNAVVAKGQKIFAVTPPGASAAQFVAIGKDGLTPPM